MNDRNIGTWKNKFRDLCNICNDHIATYLDTEKTTVYRFWIMSLQSFVKWVKPADEIYNIRGSDTQALSGYLYQMGYCHAHV